MERSHMDCEPLFPSLARCKQMCPCCWRMKEMRCLKSWPVDPGLRRRLSSAARQSDVKRRSPSGSKPPECSKINGSNPTPWAWHLWAVARSLRLFSARALAADKLEWRMPWSCGGGQSIWHNKKINREITRSSFDIFLFFSSMSRPANMIGAVSARSCASFVEDQPEFEFSRIVGSFDFEL